MIIVMVMLVVIVMILMHTRCWLILLEIQFYHDQQKNTFMVMIFQEENIYMIMMSQEEGLIEKEKRIERESIEAGEEGEMRHTEL